MRVPSSSSNKVSGQGLPPVSLLILGAGWTSTFLIPLLDKENIIYAATSTTGRERTIPFNFDPDSDDATPYLILPPAQTILITFPLKGTGQSKSLHSLYQQTHPGFAPNYLQLGSTGIWQIENQPVWIDRHTSYDKSNVRAVAEDELMSLGGAVLNLAGLWGGKRQPRDWVSRVAANKEQLKGKGSLHLVHGEDVAKAIMALHKNFTPGERWVSLYSFMACSQHLAIPKLIGR